MKLISLKNKLKEELTKKGIDIKHFIRNGINFEKGNREDKQLKIIGVTGSYGKSTVCYILHEYLKSLGYKSVLYSSAMIDSPASLYDKNESTEISFHSNEELLEIIECAEKYDADYLILEVNESTIAKGLTKDIPFTVRCLTNLNPKHNLEMYTQEEYVNIKKSFFKNLDDECICVYGLQDYDKELFNELLELNNMPKITFTSKYIAGVKGVDPNTIDCLLTDMKETNDGFTFKVKTGDTIFTHQSNNEFRHNVLNYLCVTAILKALNEFDSDKLTKCIMNLKFPGRSETYKVNGRIIVVDLHLPKALETLKSLKEEGKIKKIKVVVGSIGSGFSTWEERFKTNEFIKAHKKARKFAMELLKEYADYVYLTENDNAAESVLSICTELQNNLEGQISSVIIENREEAIKKALLESKTGDAILIAGRGNRRIFCSSETAIKLVKDAEVVEKVIEKLNWK